MGGRTHACLARRQSTALQGGTAEAPPGPVHFRSNHIKSLITRSVSDRSGSTSSAPASCSCSMEYPPVATAIERAPDDARAFDVVRRVADHDHPLDGLGRNVVGFRPRARDRHQRIAIRRIVAERAPLEELPDLEMLQLDLGGLAIVAGQQRQVQVIVRRRALRATRARPASSPCGPGRDAESPPPAAAGSCRESDDGSRSLSGRPACVSAFETRYESVRPPKDSPLKPSVMPNVCSNARVMARSPARPLKSRVPSISNKISAGFILPSLRHHETTAECGSSCAAHPSPPPARAACRPRPWRANHPP